MAPCRSYNKLRLLLEAEVLKAKGEEYTAALYIWGSEKKFGLEQVGRTKETNLIFWKLCQVSCTAAGGHLALICELWQQRAWKRETVSSSRPVGHSHPLVLTFERQHRPASYREAHWCVFLPPLFSQNVKVLVI